MATLKSLVDETTNIKNELVECRDTLKQILIGKEIEGLGNVNKLPGLINKVSELVVLNKIFLIKDGKFTGIYTYSVKHEDRIVYNDNSIDLNGTHVYLNSIDFSKYKYLYLDVAYTQKNSGNYCININTTNTDNGTSGAGYIAGNSSSGSFGRTTKSINLSNINSTYHLNLTSYLSTLTLYNIWLEK